MQCTVDNNLDSAHSPSSVYIDFTANEVGTQSNRPNVAMAVYLLNPLAFAIMGKYCKDDRDASLSSSYVNVIGPLARNCHSFKFVQNRSKIFW